MSKAFVGFGGYGFWSMPSHREVTVLAWVDQGRQCKLGSLSDTRTDWDERARHTFQGGFGLYLDNDLEDEAGRAEFCQLLAALLGAMSKPTAASVLAGAVAVGLLSIALLANTVQLDRGD